MEYIFGRPKNTVLFASNNTADSLICNNFGWVGITFRNPLPLKILPHIHG